MKNDSDNLATVVICGRQNVGKSTLFNTLIEKNHALVSDIAGTTRDSNQGVVEWNRKSFSLIDTAGLLEAQLLSKKKIKVKDQIDQLAHGQTIDYLKQADLIIFLVDVKVGLTSEDLDLARAIYQSERLKKRTILVANKVDNNRLLGEVAQFNKLGLGEPLAVSAINGSRTGDLLDLIVSQLKPKNKKKKTVTPEPQNLIKVCLLGKPNVGKSSLFNSILGYDKVIVSPQAHTTREPQHVDVTYKDRLIRFIDTAGISKKTQKKKSLERLGIEKSINSLKKSDIALLILDISEPITHQDLSLVDEIVKEQISLYIIANKWDLVEDRDTKKWTNYVYTRLPFALWAPLQFLSAKTGEKVNKIMDTILTIADERQQELSPSQTEKLLKRIVKIHKPAKGKGTKAPHIFEFRQIKSNPPKFIVRIGANDNLHFSYVRFMENRLREKTSFLGTPIVISVINNKKGGDNLNKVII